MSDGEINRKCDILPSYPPELLRSFSKLALCHLELLAEEFAARVSPAAYTNFKRLWSWFQEWPLEDKLLFCSGPSAYDWITRGEYLRDRDLLERYEESYILPHLRSFNLALLSYITLRTPVGEGNLWPVEGRFIPLSQGRIVIQCQNQVTRALSWSLDRHGLQIRDTCGKVIAFGRCNTSAKLRSVKSVFEIHNTACIEGLAVRVHGASYRAPVLQSNDNRAMRDEFHRILPRLAAALTEFGPYSIHSIGPSEDSGWLPGHLELEVLAGEKALDLAIERDIRGRRAYIAKLTSKDMIHVLEPQPDRRLTYDMACVSKKSESSVLAVRKTNVGRSSMVDWSLLDFIAHLSQPEVMKLREAAFEISFGSEEGAAYLRAACHYCLGQYEECIGYLHNCLSYGNCTEEYLLLLAFAHRHAGRYEQFENIVFRPPGVGR